MYYSPHEGLHACRDGDCEHAHGIRLAQAKLDNTGHEVIDLPRSAYHEVHPVLLGVPPLFDVPREPWSSQRWQLLVGLRYGVRLDPDPRAFVRLTGC